MYIEIRKCFLFIFCKFVGGIFIKINIKFCLCNFIGKVFRINSYVCIVVFVIVVDFFDLVCEVSVKDL